MRRKQITATGSGIIADADGEATLWTVNINTGATSAILKLYDGVAATGTPITIDATTKSSHAYGFAMRNGIYYDLSGGNADVTVGYG